jgi:hypothetical protein
LQRLGSCRHVETHDQPVALGERVARDGGFDLFMGDDVEGQVELVFQLVLPLLDKVARCDNEAALKIAANNKLLDQQARHDGLASAGVIGKQEPQRLTRKQLTVNGRDLVRQGVDARTVDREVGIEQVREPDALSLGANAECLTVAIELKARVACTSSSRGSASRKSSTSAGPSAPR